MVSVVSLCVRHVCVVGLVSFRLGTAASCRLRSGRESSAISSSGPREPPHPHTTHTERPPRPRRPHPSCLSLSLSVGVCSGPEDLQKLAEDPALSAGVDLLSELFSDSEEGVRFKAMEVYIRRVYRAHNIISIQVSHFVREGYTHTHTQRHRWSPTSLPLSLSPPL